MARAYIIDVAGATAAQYDAAMQDMALDAPPPGAVFHVAGPTEGGWRVIDLWDDPDAFDAFVQSAVAPAIGRAGMGQPATEAIEIAGQMAGTMRAPGFAAVLRLPGVTREAFERLSAKAVPDGRAPAGMIHHVNGPCDGGYCVIGLWNSMADRDAFVAASVRPHLSELDMTGPPSFEDLQVHNSLVGAPAAA